MNSSEIQFYEGLQWRRLSEIYPGQRVARKHAYRTHYLRQNKEGNQYFVAVLDSLTDHDERIDKCMVTKEVNDAGIYQIKMFVNGLRTSIVVDDYVPWDPKTQLPAFLHSETQELWALLLEKAWAKLHGSY